MDSREKITDFVCKIIKKDNDRLSFFEVVAFVENHQQVDLIASTTHSFVSLHFFCLHKNILYE